MRTYWYTGISTSHSFRAVHSEFCQTALLVILTIWQPHPHCHTQLVPLQTFPHLAVLDGKEGKATETKLERGTKLIKELLADKKEISIRELDEKAKEQGISGRTMRDVRSRMKNELEYRVNEKQENSIRLKE